MPTLPLKLTFKPKGNVSEIEILGKVRSMEQEASCWLIRNKKTSLKSVHSAKYHEFRSCYHDLHSQWVISALKTDTSIVHQFNKRRQKGKAKRPKLKKPFVSLSPHLFNVSLGGRLLKVKILKTTKDLEPIVLQFKLHGKYVAFAHHFIQMAGLSRAALVLENLKGMKVGIVKKRKVSRRMRQRLLNFWTMGHGGVV